MKTPTQYIARWWFQICFIFTSVWGRFPFWLIFFNWVETTNQIVKTPTQWFMLFSSCFVGRWNLLSGLPISSGYVVFRECNVKSIKKSDDLWFVVGLFRVDTTDMEDVWPVGIDKTWWNTIKPPKDDTWRMIGCLISILFCLVQHGVIFTILYSVMVSKKFYFKLKPSTRWLQRCSCT